MDQGPEVMNMDQASEYLQVGRDKLVEFMNNPQIMGISLNSDSKTKDNSANADEAGNDEDAGSDKAKPPQSKPPQ